MRKALVQTGNSSGKGVVASNAKNAGASNAAANRRSRCAKMRPKSPGAIAVALSVTAVTTGAIVQPRSSATHHRFDALLRVVERGLHSGLTGEGGLDGGRHGVA